MHRWIDTTGMVCKHLRLGITDDHQKGRVVDGGIAGKTLRRTSGTLTKSRRRPSRNGGIRTPDKTHRRCEAAKRTWQGSASSSLLPETNSFPFSDQRIVEVSLQSTTILKGWAKSRRSCAAGLIFTQTTFPQTRASPKKIRLDASWSSRTTPEGFGRITCRSATSETRKGGRSLGKT